MPPHPITPAALIQRLDALGAKGAGTYCVAGVKDWAFPVARQQISGTADRAVDAAHGTSHPQPGDCAGVSPTPRSENSAGGECGPVASHVFAPHHAVASGCDPFFHGADNA